MLALTVYLQNTWARLKERQEGQTMAEYALILGLIAIFVMIAVFFLGGKIKDLFNSTGSSVANAPNGLGSEERASTEAAVAGQLHRPGAAASFCFREASLDPRFKA
jgi:Flp pilus assembly pilin Flp